jgi:hypothetical protein
MTKLCQRGGFFSAEVVKGKMLLRLVLPYGTYFDLDLGLDLSRFVHLSGLPLARSS